MHHIVSDGWSMGVLSRELAALYEAFARGRRSPLPELPVQYADYAAWQREWLQGEVLRGAAGLLEGDSWPARPALELPTDRPRPARADVSRGAAEPFELPEDADGRRSRR